MTRTIAILTVLAGLSLLAGCADITVRRPEPATYAPPPPPPTQPGATAPPADPRTIADLQRENARLRTDLAKLEQNYQGWRASLRTKDAEVKQLKDQRDRVEEERDAWKKKWKKKFDD